jgi:predicted O-methyltransferase YrrM
MRWLFLNVRRRISYALKNPLYAIRSMMRELTLADERFLAKVTGRTAREIRRFIAEPAGESRFLQHLRSCESELRRAEAEGANLYAKKVLLQYALIRAVKPELIVETGVASGVSSSYLLLALHQNQRGTLHSVDIGDRHYVPPGRATGWVTPDWLRSRWHLHIGDTALVLRAVLDQLAPLDVFIHDSLHTYEHMSFEFNLAFPYLRAGGILVADDALWNPAFREFAEKVSSPAAQVVRGIGIMRKQLEEH